MSTTAVILADTFATIVIKKWLEWQKLKQREAGHVWSEADVADFLKDIQADTPAAIEAEVRAGV